MYKLLIARGKYILMPMMVAALMFVAVVAPAAASGPAADIVAPEGATAVLHYPDYAIGYSTMQSLTVNLDTAQLFTGAQLIIDALSSPYLLIAGLGLGVSILGAILAAVTKLRI
jgi:hypothetical protein